MAVSEQIPYISYIANGSTLEFPITFDLSNPDYLFVAVNKVIPLSGTYSIDMTAKKIVFASAPNEGDQIELYRENTLDRDTNYQSYDNSFRPSAINFDFDKIWHVLQEQHLIDAEILARLKEEIEWRRTHDANFDELSKMRDAQVFSGLLGYVNTYIGATNPNIFGGVTAGVVFALDNKSVQTHLEEIANDLEDIRNNIQNTGANISNLVSAERDRALIAETNLDQKINTEKLRAQSAETVLQTNINAVGVGNKAYLTYADAVADKANIPNNSKVTVTNDSTSSNNGDWQYSTASGGTFTKSTYDPVTIAANDATNKANSAKQNANAYTEFKTEKLIVGAVGKNLFNINAADISLGMYPSNSTGALLPNASYNTTGYIQVVAGQTYTAAEKHYWCWYDANKTFISGTNNTNSNLTQTAPAGAAFMRASCSVAGWSTFQVELGSTKTAFEAYSISINNASIKDNSLTTAKIADKNITQAKTSFMEQGKNLFNINASDNVLDKYVNYTNGVLVDNASYNATGFILIDPTKTYTLSYTYMRAFYDASKTFISGSVGSSATFTPPTGAVYARFTVIKTSWNAFQVELGNTSTSFEKYGFKFTQDVILDQNIYTPTLVLPPKIYVLANLQAHIYPEHLLVENHDLYLHDITCTRGNQMRRGWVYDVPTSQAAGNISLSWSLSDRQTGSALVNASTTVVVADQTKSGTKNVLVVGDSRINAGVVTQRLLDIAVSDPLKVNLIGTRGTGTNKHEGRGGWKVSDYATVGRTFYKFTVSGVTTAPAINSTLYTFAGSTFLVQELALSGGSGTITAELTGGTAPTSGSSGALTKVSGSGDSSIAFTDVQSVSGNPFWRATGTPAIDFPNYLSTNSLATPDYVIIDLGVNDSFNFTTDADVEALTTTAFAQLDTLITSIKAANSSVKIGIAIPAVYANQDAFGISYQCGQTAWRAKRNIVIWNRKLIAYFSNKEAQNIYLVASGLNVDTENNYPTTTQAINSQNSNTVTIQNNGVHPDTSGYKQIGDALFAFIKAV